MLYVCKCKSFIPDKMEKLWSIMWLCVCVRQQWTTDGNENSFKPLTDEYINKERIKWLLRTNKLFKYVKKTKSVMHESFKQADDSRGSIFCPDFMTYCWCIH